MLCGVDLAIESLAIDQTLQPEDYSGRTSHHPQRAGPAVCAGDLLPFDPYSNSSLEGLYASGGLLSTQCEAEGFRRISLHPDRPDVLSRWTVRIEASRSSCPVLLSNGNAVQEESVGADRHAVTWDDLPKPSSLCPGGWRSPGDPRSVHDVVGPTGHPAIACGGGDEPFTAHAMASLKRSMQWDESLTT